VTLGLTSHDFITAKGDSWSVLRRWKTVSVNLAGLSWWGPALEQVQRKPSGRSCLIGWAVTAKRGGRHRERSGPRVVDSSG